MGRQKKIVSATDQRPFVMVYNDFLESTLLEAHEKIVFIALKRFADSRNQCYPSFKKLAEITGLSKRTVQAVIKQLEVKHVIAVENRRREDGGKSSNLYTLYDFKEMWNAESGEEMVALIDEHDEERLVTMLRAKGYKVHKEKELESEPTKARNQALNTNQSYIENNTTGVLKSQDRERYRLDEIKQLFEYEIMIADNPYRKDEIDSVMEILYGTLNTTKDTVKINGEEKPAMVVVGKLMKLTSLGIMYAIGKFSEQTERIKNPTGYMLTLLYHAEEQRKLDVVNQFSHNNQ